MPNNLEYSVLSYHCYNKANQLPLPSGWSWYSTSGFSITGYSATAYINHQTDEVIIAHRGSDSFVDQIISDIQLTINEVPVQFNDAVVFINQVLSLMQAHSCESYTVSFTGHSLGGVLAQLSATELPNTKVVAFDNPGISEILSENGLSLQSGTQITEYLTAPNAVNTVNTHIGTIKRLYPDYEARTLSAPITTTNLYIDFSLQQHGMKEITEQFNPASGEPRVYSEPSSWPSNGLDWFKRFADNPHYWEICFDKSRWDRDDRISLVNNLLGGFSASGIPTTTIYSDGSVPQIFGTTLGSNIVRSHTGGEWVYIYRSGISRNLLLMVA